MDAIFCENGQWFFYQEDWATVEGPFESREAAQKGMNDYANKFLLDNYVYTD